METYYSSEPKIQEWIDQIIEKLFTACLLSGNDSDSEFNKGTEAVARIAAIMQEISDYLPPEVLYDGVQQLLEQRLPDSRVIENFPIFYEYMDRMIREGILTHINSIPGDSISGESDSENILLNSVPALSLLNPNNNASSKVTITRTPSPSSIPVSLSNSFSIRDHIIDTKNLDASVTINKNSVALILDEVNTFVEDPKLISPNSEQLSKKILTESKSVLQNNKEVFKSKTGNCETISTLELKEKEDKSKINVLESNKPQSTTDIVSPTSTPTTPVVPANPKEPIADSKPLSTLKEKPLTKTMQDLENTNSSTKAKIIKPSQIPQEAQLLELILKNVFPSSTIKWNLSLGKFKFIAQVDKLLIYVSDKSTEQTQAIQEMTKQGWKVFCCATEDLAFPRRLERGIRNTLRSR